MIQGGTTALHFTSTVLHNSVRTYVHTYVHMYIQHHTSLYVHTVESTPHETLRTDEQRSCYQNFMYQNSYVRRHTQDIAGTICCFHVNQNSVLSDFVLSGLPCICTCSTYISTI